MPPSRGYTELASGSTIGAKRIVPFICAHSVIFFAFVSSSSAVVRRWRRAGDGPGLADPTSADAVGGRGRDGAHRGALGPQQQLDELVEGRAAKPLRDVFCVPGLTGTRADRYLPPQLWNGIREPPVISPPWPFT